MRGFGKIWVSGKKRLDFNNIVIILVYFFRNLSVL